ncbi:MAG TPA: hypothetical protein VK843_02505, partial [Planctomycetota bacterium]|nr:hypothetical protein [Planctomycetota bacterium]
DGTANVTLKRWSYKDRKRRDAVRELDQQLATMGIKEVDKDKSYVFDDEVDARHWSEPRGDQKVARGTIFFVAKGYLFVLDIELPEGWGDLEGHRRWRSHFLDSFDMEGLVRDPHDLFLKQATWSGELKYNLWFSLGSTLAFIALTLALAWWRLSRIDF